MKVVAYTPINFTEKELIAGMLNNDKKCFSQIYDTHAAKLFGLILRWVKEKDTAEILLCNAFTKAWHNKYLFETETEGLFCWLCRLARICYHENSVEELYKKNSGF